MRLKVILKMLLLLGMMACGDASVSLDPEEMPVNIESVNVNDGVCFKNWQELENFCYELYGDSNEPN